jgi:4-hydroxy-3-polyprenylbenzoate decarboxylase
MQSEFRGGDLSLERHAHAVHAIDDMTAGPASGSWRHDGMIICPCSMSSLASIASGAGINLIHRAADVTLKERRKLVVIPRETPLTSIHLRNMQTITEAGAVIMPFSPAYYDCHTTLDQMVQHFAGRILDQLRIENNICARWRETIEVAC